MGAVDPLEALRWIGARKSAQVMRDRVEVAVGPEGDPGEAAAGIEVYCVGAAAELGRQQKNPIAKASAAEIRLGVDQLALDIVALGFRVGIAGMPGAVGRNG